MTPPSTPTPSLDDASPKSPSLMGPLLQTPAESCLCERCGYGLQGLPGAGNCPECGQSVAASLPSARPGSPWQQDPHLFTWLATNWLAITSPRKLFRSIRIGPSKLSLLWVNLFMGGMVIWLIYAVISLVLTVVPFTAEWAMRELPLDGTIPLLVFVIFVTAAARGLVKIEEWGIRTWGKVHRRRITPRVARCVVDHASVGWLLPLPILLIAHLVDSVILHTDAWMEVAFKVNSAFRFFGMRDATVVSMIFSALAIGFVPAILVFEILVYLGIRQCQYANPPHAATVQASGQASGEALDRSTSA